MKVYRQGTGHKGKFHLCALSPTGQTEHFPIIMLAGRSLDFFLRSKQWETEVNHKVFVINMEQVG